VEFSWFQFRHAEANLAEWNDTLDNVKLLYERNLAEDPTSEHLAYNATRRVQMQNLLDWSGCVFRIAAQDGDIAEHENNIIGTFQEMLGGSKANGGLSPHLPQILLENEAMAESLTARDQLWFAVGRESKAIAKFGNLANRILDGHPIDVYDDLQQFQHLQGKSKAQKMAELIKPLKTDAPGAAEARKMTGELESLLHLLSGKSTASSTMLLPTSKREALSSTISTGWENLADWHMRMYMFAVS
jgi:hypothetical protein